MPFNTLAFALFFAAVLVLYRRLKTWRAQKYLLLGASYLFYAAWYPPYLVLLLISTGVDWWLARRIDRSSQPARRRALLLVSLACNLGLLAFFKYGGFALQTLDDLTRAFGLTPALPAWNILLPIGISFYTFASLSYTIDVYRGEIRGDCRLFDYALFVAFFPHLIAGPIVRARLLLPQFAAPRTAQPDQLRWGLAVIVFGLFLKNVLADALFAPLVEKVYAAPQEHGALDAWAAVFGFSGQIYCDFAGYSLCAIGLALCFGFEFPDNFRYPYAAASFSDFWRRWHISLSTWLRDYLYVPLGGNRGGTFRTCRNLLLTMLIGGFWHGASWMFVLWGALHGVYLVAERLFSGPQRRARDSVVAALGVFLIVTLSWIPFRAANTANARALVAALFRPEVASTLAPLAVALCFFAVAALWLWHRAQRAGSLEAAYARLGPTLQAGAIAVGVVAIYLCSGGDQHAFLYFQF